MIKNFFKSIMVLFLASLVLLSLVFLVLKYYNHPYVIVREDTVYAKITGRDTFLPYYHYLSGGRIPARVQYRTTFEYFDPKIEKVVKGVDNTVEFYVSSENEEYVRARLKEYYTFWNNEDTYHLLEVVSVGGKFRFKTTQDILRENKVKSQ